MDDNEILKKAYELVMSAGVKCIHAGNMSGLNQAQETALALEKVFPDVLANYSAKRAVHEWNKNFPDDQMTWEELRNASQERRVYMLKRIMEFTSNKGTVQ